MENVTASGIAPGSAAQAERPVQLLVGVRIRHAFGEFFRHVTGGDGEHPDALFRRFEFDSPGAECEEMAVRLRERDQRVPS